MNHGYWTSALVSLGLLRERLPGERRVALTPADVKRLSAKAIVTVETGAGLEAGFPDDAYANAGAHLADLQQVLDGSAVIAKVRAPDASQTPRAGGVLISLGGRDAGLEKRLQERPVSHLALERVPRISRAQTMDVLSSQASVAGYVASHIFRARSSARQSASRLRRKSATSISTTFSGGDM